MSFLGQLDELEEDATLQDALAFIDTFDNENAYPAPSAERRSAALKRTSKGARPKFEIERLRRQVAKLEKTLEQLKSADTQSNRRYSSPSAVSQVHDASSHSPSQSQWMEILVQEYRHRRQAELTNGQLRALLSKQIQMIHSSQAAFAYMFTEADMSLLYNSQQTMARQHATMENARIIESLAHRIQRLKLDKDKVIQSAGLADASWSLSRTVRSVDPRFGLYLETSSCLPISCSMEYADTIIWQRIRLKMMQSQDPNVEIPEGLTKLHFHEHNEHTYRLVTRMTIHRQMEKDHAVYYWSAISPVTCKGLRFIEDQMVIIKRAPAPSSHPSKPTTLLQSWIRVSAEPTNPSRSCRDLDVEDPDSFKEILMDKLSKRLSTYLTSLTEILEVR